MIVKLQQLSRNMLAAIEQQLCRILILWGSSTKSGKIVLKQNAIYWKSIYSKKRYEHADYNKMYALVTNSHNRLLFSVLGLGLSRLRFIIFVSYLPRIHYTLALSYVKHRLRTFYRILLYQYTGSKGRESSKDAGYLYVVHLPFITTPYYRSPKGMLIKRGKICICKEIDLEHRSSKVSKKLRV